MIIELVRKSLTHYELKKFYREAGDPPGSGKAHLCAALMNLPPSVHTVTLDASGGTDEKNTRSKWLRWFIKDRRTFGTWTMNQLSAWMKEHGVPQGFQAFVTSQTLKEARKWVRVLASNEKLVQYYIKLGFSTTKKGLLPVVQMKGSVKKILAHCK